MSTMSRSPFVFRRSIAHSLTLLCFALLMTVGLAACDSGGANSGTEDSNDEPDIAKTFTVTVKKIDDSYPYSSSNRKGVAYAINDTVGKEIILERGKTYEFVLEQSVASGPSGDPHPFYIGETAKGAGGDEFRSDPAKKTSGTVTFSPPSGAPDSLFYQCDLHVYMGGKITVTGSTSGGSGDDGSDGGGDDDGGY
jgi:hypothetical protein